MMNLTQVSRPLSWALGASIFIDSHFKNVFNILSES